MSDEDGRGLVSRSRRAARRFDLVADGIGGWLVKMFQLLALFVIGGTIVWAAVTAYLDMVGKGHADLHDILLLFIYLELGAMVGIYFHTNRLPVEFLLFVAITIITRTLVQVEELSDVRILVLIGAVLILAVSIALLHYGTRRTGGTNRTGVTDLD
ncbi:MAG: phosphate-starvation-inducible protein PsiE [Bauldia sp.]